MFSQTWKKYLPVITILIKRAISAEQVMSMNNTDFERAAGGRKIKFSFSHLQLNKGRVNTEVKHTPFARELATVLQEDDITKMLIADQFLEFSLNNNFQLTIRNTAPVEEVATTHADAVAGDDSENIIAGEPAE